MPIIGLTHARPTKYFLQHLSKGHIFHLIACCQKVNSHSQKQSSKLQKNEGDLILKIKITFKPMSKYGHAKKCLFFVFT